MGQSSDSGHWEHSGKMQLEGHLYITCDCQSVSKVKKVKIYDFFLPEASKYMLSVHFVLPPVPLASLWIGWWVSWSTIKPLFSTIFNLNFFLLRTCKTFKRNSFLLNQMLFAWVFLVFSKMSTRKRGMYLAFVKILLIQIEIHMRRNCLHFF